MRNVQENTYACYKLNGLVNSWKWNVQENTHACYKLKGLVNSWKSL